ncbi:MAG TPA: hydroxymethylbilane synthase [Planctomycetaceae bacterium]|nr:hydroxymethylbilane synthase [Planctomycetaceae bacterium]HRE99128.1 hydroxymethylbilane synthase [Pirellulaceae bacterium]
MTASTPIRLGTRASLLARWQADWTAARLRERGHEVEIVEIATRGDLETRPLGEIGGQGLFTKAIQTALLENAIDLAVHSLKDLPTDRIDGLRLGAIPEREPVGDLLIGREPTDLESLAPGAIIGTGSLRRRAQLLHARPDLDVRDIRGNLDTRLRKLDDGDYDAIVLAAAGIGRLGWDHVAAWPIPIELMFPAVGQGALGWEIRSDDARMAEVLAPLDHAPSRFAVTAERALLRELRAGCLAPVGAYGRVEGTTLHLDAVVLDPQGIERIDHRLCWADITLDDATAEEAGESVARELKQEGATRLIDPARRPSGGD